MFYDVGTLLSINGLPGKVIGYIQYENTQDPGKFWTEYRLKTQRGEAWLSCDEFYDEYSVSYPANDVGGRIGPEWHKVDEGTQIVRFSSGDVDVDPGESASFIEYEDASEDHTLSVEIWSDGTEFSKGEYIEKSDIVETGFEAPVVRKTSNLTALYLVFGFVFVWVLVGIVLPNLNTGKSIAKYVKNSEKYIYETSISGSEKQKASVYAYQTSATTDDVAKDIIQGIEGNTRSVIQKDDTADEEIAILTDKEYCLVYHPENEGQKVYVQVSGRKYNYTSDNAPYRSSAAGTLWYRSHYYSVGYASDSVSYKGTPSAYSMYNGTTIHNIGNGYFDSYSSSIRQSSINSRKSSSGGLSSGK
ncbi:MAG: DUF4178 domain-containing protein [Lachnoclostridium sp.]|nr:DUF4178 domain-containing protein [Lachnospira sp.]MCM1246918.1 DUF4178 domain-containing protein [Lachnoclostridium sp.]MCM1536314.1 DUF4178 domain-containing protein [Clostridium sp.]